VTDTPGVVLGVTAPTTLPCDPAPAPSSSPGGQRGQTRRVVSLGKPKLLALDSNRVFIERDVEIDVRFFRKCFVCLDVEGKGEIDIRRFTGMLETFKRAAELGPADSMIQAAESFDQDHSGGVSYQEFRQKFTEKHLHVRLNTAERIFMTFEDPSTSMLARFIQALVLCLIVVSCVCFIMESHAEFREQPLPWPEYGVCVNETRPEDREQSRCFSSRPEPWKFFTIVDLVCITLFGIEYLIRFGTAHAVRYILWEDLNDILDLVCSPHTRMPPPPTRLQRTWRFAKHPMNIVDFTAVFFGVLGQSGAGPSLAMLRILRLTRVFRLFKRSKYSDVLGLTAKVMRESLEPLYILVFYFALGVIIFSSMIYYFEKGKFEGPTEEHPTGYYTRALIPRELDEATGKEKMVVSPFISIPKTFWWCIVTLTSVGYGDMYPVTTAGRVLAVFTMLSGIIVLAMPIGVIGSNFTTELRNFKEDQRAQHDARVREWLQIQDELMSDRPMNFAEVRRVSLLTAGRNSEGGNKKELNGEVPPPGDDGGTTSKTNSNNTLIAASAPSGSTFGSKVVCESSDQTQQLREILDKAQQIRRELERAPLALPVQAAGAAALSSSSVNGGAASAAPTAQGGPLTREGALCLRPPVDSADHGAGPDRSASSCSTEGPGSTTCLTTPERGYGQFRPMGGDTKSRVIALLDEALDLSPEKALPQIAAMEAAALNTLYQAQPHLRRLLDAYQMHADQSRCACGGPDGERKEWSSCGSAAWRCVRDSRQCTG